MNDDNTDSLLGWDEIAVGFGNLFLPILTKIVDWVDKILKAIIEALGGES